MGVFRQFPYSNFHEMNMDEILKILKTMQDEWNATKTEWASYKDFIDNYFANLDVSEEISNKLNQMASDGSLALILEPNTVNAVNAWLTAHITNPTNPVIDETLLIHGAAAESASAGRIVRSAMTTANGDNGYEITNADMVANEIWDSSNGNHVYSVNTRWVATPYMLYFPVKAGQPFKITLSSDYTISINFYNEMGEFVGHSEGTHIGWIGYDATYIAFNVRRTDNDTITGRVFTVYIENLYTEEVIHPDRINIFDDIDVGFYYDTTTGHGASSSSLARTPIYKCDDVGMFFTNVTSRITAVFWDKNKNFLGFNSVENTETPYYAKLRVIPENAYYVGFTVHNTSLTEFAIKQINSSGLTIGDMSDSMKYAIIKNCYYYNDSLSSINSYDACVLVNCDFDTVYNLADSSGGITFIDRESNVIDYHPTYVSDMHYGRRYERPADAYITVILLKHGQFATNSGAYFSLSYDTVEPGTLKGKHVYCIGDSITWLDSTDGVAPDTSLLAGFQKQIRRSGAIVDSLGVNGGTLVDMVGENSIYRGLVNTDPDFTIYDEIIIEGGLNDIRVTAPIGTVANNYENPNVTTSNVVGAIGAIIQMIRAENPTCNIYLCTPLPTGDANRNYAKMMTYREAMIETATYWGVPVIDLTTVAQRDIATASHAFTYDGTHPNNEGMEVIGKAITGAMISLYNMV